MGTQGLTQLALYPECRMRSGHSILKRRQVGHFSGSANLPQALLD